MVLLRSTTALTTRVSGKNNTLCSQMRLMTRSETVLKSPWVVKDEAESDSLYTLLGLAACFLCLVPLSQVFSSLIALENHLRRFCFKYQCLEPSTRDSDSVGLQWDPYSLLPSSQWQVTELNSNQMWQQQQKKWFGGIMYKDIRVSLRVRIKSS